MPLSPRAIVKKNFFASSFLLVGSLFLVSAVSAAPSPHAIQIDEDFQELEELGELNEVVQAVAAANVALTAKPVANSSALANSANAPVANTNTQPASNVSVVPVKAIYVYENQPVQIVDSQGRLIQVIYLIRKK